MIRTSRNLWLRSITVISFFLAGATLGAQTTTWKIYTYSSDGFSVSFPSDPAVESHTVPVESLSLELRTYLVEDPPAGMMIGVSALGALAAGKDPDALLQGGKEGALKNTQTHLVSEKKISLGANPGLEFEAENESLHATIRIYLAETTLYEAIVAHPIGKPYEHAAVFFDSFRLIPKPEK